MSDVPLVFLDVDGVINAPEAAWGSRSPECKTVKIADDLTVDVTYEFNVLARLSMLNALEVIEVRWCTTWCLVPDALESAFGHVARFPCAFTSEVNGASTHVRSPLAAAYVNKMKAHTVEDALSSGRRVVWVDDEMAPLPGDAAFITWDDQLLSIRPKPERGLRPRDLDSIEFWARDL